jgi:hypothetical protein
MGTLNIRFNSLFEELEQIDRADVENDIKEWLQADVEFVEPDLGEPSREEEYRAYLELTHDSLLER